MGLTLKLHVIEEGGATSFLIFLMHEVKYVGFHSLALASEDVGTMEKSFSRSLLGCFSRSGYFRLGYLKDPDR